MNEFAEAFVSVTTPTAIITTLAFGLIVGAFYGYDLAPRVPAHYPWQFWMVGLLFIGILAALGQIGGTVAPLPNSLGRAALWTFLCGAIPLGRWARIRLSDYLGDRKR